jgi:hypothetical protein
VENQEPGQSLTLRIDKTPPVISGMPGTNCELWPANGTWRHVATLSASDALSGFGPDSLLVTVENSELPEQANADVLVKPGQGGDLEVLVRATRLGSGSGRVYSITASAQDLAGNITTAAAACVVPHDRGRR